MSDTQQSDSTLTDAQAATAGVGVVVDENASAAPAAQESPSSLVETTASDAEATPAVAAETAPLAAEEIPAPLAVETPAEAEATPAVATETAQAAASIEAKIPAQVATVEPVIIDESKPAVTEATVPHGRIDSHGNVFVTRPDGTEAKVGQHLAGTPAQALEFFQSKYVDLKLRADNTLRRLRDKAAKPSDAGVVLKELKACLDQPTCVGDLSVFATLVESLDAAAAVRAEEVKASRDAAQAEALKLRMEIVLQAESLADSTEWKKATERLKELLDEWKRAGHASRDAEQELWIRFSAARKGFDKRRKIHFAERDAERETALLVKNALIKEAEALSGSTDWATTAREYTALMNRWKAAPRARTGEENSLWTRFRAAQDTFFKARSLALDARDEEYKGNLGAKEALADEAVALLPITDQNFNKVKATLRTIQDKWEKLGHVPRNDKERVEGKLHTAEEAVRNFERDKWRRTNPEARDRAAGVVEQFRTALAKIDAEIDAAKDAGKKSDLSKRRATTVLLLEAAENAAAEYVS
jgi:hypothetical protein